MKFTVQKSAFMNKLTPAMGTVSNKNTIASIEGVLIETVGDSQIRVSTYDMNKGVRATVDVISVEREGSFIINAQRLYQTVRVLPDDEMTLEVDESFNCTLTCGKSTFSMFAISGTEFPNLPDLMTERGMRLGCGTLRKMISKVAHSVAEQDNRPMLCGAFFRIGENKIEAVSCDSFTLSIATEEVEITGLGSEDARESTFIIPGHALPEIMRILPDSDEETVDMYLSRKHAILRLPEIIFFTRTIDSEYIDYTRLIPKDNDIVLTLERERLLGALERANIIAEEKIQGSGRSYVKLNVEDRFLAISSTSVNGKVYDEVDCIHEGGNLEIGFNCRYLINSVKVAEGENIVVTMKSPTQSITIEPLEKDEKSSYFYMVLPVRMNG